MVIIMTIIINEGWCSILDTTELSVREILSGIKIDFSKSKIVIPFIPSLSHSLNRFQCLGHSFTVTIFILNPEDL